MVNPATNRRGASMTGCLISLVVTIIAVYYGMQVGRVYYRFYAIKDKIDSAALFAQTEPTEQILRNLRQAADDVSGTHHRWAATQGPGTKPVLRLVFEPRLL